MQKEVSPGIVISAVAVVVLVVGFFIYRGVVGDQSSAPTQMGAQLSKVIDRTGGDVSKMTPDEKKVYDQAVKIGYYRAGPSGYTGSSGKPR